MSDPPTASVPTIVRVSAAVLEPAVRVDGWSLVTGQVPRLPCVAVKVETEDGHAGLGLIGALQPFDAPAGAIRECVAYLGARLIGKELRIAPLMTGMAQALFGFPEVRAGFEMAFHEVAAHAGGRSIASMLGGRRHDRLPVSRMVSLQSPELMGRAAADLVADGFRVIKFKLGGNSDLDVARARAVRAAVGDAVRLTADANGRYGAKSAIDTIGLMDACAIDIIEQPVPREDLDGLRMVTHAVRPMVEADESAGSPAEIARLGRDRAVDSVVLRLPRLGGVTAVLECVAICRAFGLRYRFGVCFLPGPFQAFAAQVASILPDLPLAHELAEHALLDGDPFEGPDIRDGYLTVPDRVDPAWLGAGQAIDWVVLAS
ncbi:mandelate racemase/muconate lactonizing enzyme family protein [Azospirillum sp. RWY-5-1]|uniref:Mandelate racemase/muconate lactonizing enzyme family protein n=1 Tax=Azospirillum oleiclasticum TaxID=2735135 RepID=A0ABX2TIY7_9PROT|nr:mandelate racemase/muconate lactonizing enzyme family protein [Azospirillum oleiclasticum]NYZ14536.1 mandelate racemase/muconate lactonizing enzyme family protein [Azospirillum oleiclasticum]NYZ24314.1 mandelate racemase/muconate lactonizing enzyme family protein [Azospirillum oleiclasticum]